jgi:hypothetical protein
LSLARATQRKKDPNVQTESRNQKTSGSEKTKQNLMKEEEKEDRTTH